MKPRYAILGGVVHGPITLNFHGEPPVTAEDIQANADRTKADISIPHIQKYKSLRGRLAVVGGGASIIKQVKTLKAWPEEVWAVNGAWHWCKANGIKARFIAVDPHEVVASWVQGVDDALLVTRCHPKVFETLKANNAKIEVLNLEERDFATGSSTATTCVYLGALSGYQGITFFGCEGSYDPGRTHAYMHESRASEMMVVCCGKQFLTAPDYLVQTLELAHWAKGTGSYLQEKSGGLLRAMMKNPKYDVIWVSETLFKAMKRTDGTDDGDIRNALEEAGGHEPSGPLAVDPGFAGNVVAGFNGGDVSVCQRSFNGGGGGQISGSDGHPKDSVPGGAGGV